MMHRSLAETSRRARTAAAAVACTLSVLAGVLVARGQDQPPAPTRTLANDPIVAKVDGKPIRRSELEQRKERGMEGYREETGREVPAQFQTFFLRVALDEAVRERLIAKDGRAHGIVVSDAAAESVLQQNPRFRPNGRYDSALFEAYRRENPKSFSEVREEARDFLAFQRRGYQIERELAPDAATLDRLVANRTEKAAVRWVIVSETQFDGENDPTDAQIRETYEKQKASFVPPGRAMYRTITVPGLENGRPTTAGMARARARADSLLAELKSGVPIESLAVRPGVVAGGGTWGQGQEIGLFAGQPAWAESAFASPPGHVLPRTFDTVDGVALVRVERGTPRTPLPLAVVADDVRARWRAETVSARDRAEARRFYDAHPDSFRTPSWEVRWATVDPARVSVKEPKENELRAWFEANRNLFGRLDPSGGIRFPTFEEARAEALTRIMEERRTVAARGLADRLATAWAAGKSGPGKADGATFGGPATLLPESDPPPGLRADLADTLRSWTSAPRAVVVPEDKGFAVAGLVRKSESGRPAYAVVEAQALAAVARRRAAEERAAARAWFDANPGRYETGPGYSVVYALSPRPAPAIVDVPGPEIDRYYRTHAQEFTPPVEVRVRHILFSTERRPPSEALTLARNARGRLARGEDFVTLARELSEDMTTRDLGGDLGFIGPGSTVPAFEQAAFALTEKAPISTPVTTDFGVHLIQLVERRGGKLEPFEIVRPRIVNLLVAQHQDSLSREAAERVLREATDFRSLLTTAEVLRLPTTYARWYEGFPLTGPAMMDEFRADAASTTQGRLMPRVYRFLDQGYVVAALDSVLPSRPLAFDEASERVLSDYRREKRLAASRTRAEQVERELKAGKPWNEVTETLGGSPEPVTLSAGEALPGFGTLAAVDSLLFGPAPVPAGGYGRAETPRGTLLLAVTERIAADPAERARERESVRRTVLNRRVYDYVEGLRARARIEVLRADLADRPPAPPKIEEG